MANAALIAEINTSASKCSELIALIEQKPKARVPICSVEVKMVPVDGGQTPQVESGTVTFGFSQGPFVAGPLAFGSGAGGSKVMPRLTAKETLQEVPSFSLMADLKFAPVTRVEPDLFNDKLSYACATYADLKRLGQGMLNIALKYDMFGESEKATPALRLFRDNYKVVLEGLRAAWDCIQDKDSSLTAIQEYVNSANSAIGKAVEAKATFVQG